MFVSKNKKLLFFHIPKTAGTSLRNYLIRNCIDGTFFTNLTYELYTQYYKKKFLHSQSHQAFIDPAYKHLTQNESMVILEKLNLNFDNFFEFTIVRNPYDRLLSYYNFTLHRTYDKIDRLLDDIAINNVDPNLHFRNQLEYIKNPITKNVMIFKYENFNECQNFLQKIIGTDEKIPKLNVTKQAVVNHLSSNLKSRIFKLYEEEFDTFKYVK